MTTHLSLEQWLLNIGLLIFILGTNLGQRRITRRRLVLPVALAALAGMLLLSDAPGRGNDTALAVIGAVAGIALGILAGLFMDLKRKADGTVASRAGAAYATLWVLVIGGRVAFAESAGGWAAAAVRDFSISNHISGSAAWTTAFVIMALAMVASRVITTLVRCRALPAAPAHPLPAVHA